ncbi:MAG: hypothetical protein M1819_001767 [Sarea resinae]|nr:MAG: hypothetical protein M1819_001767 [Sarea resinae]
MDKNSCSSLLDFLSFNLIHLIALSRYLIRQTLYLIYRAVTYLSCPDTMNTLLDRFLHCITFVKDLIRRTLHLIHHAINCLCRRTLLFIHFAIESLLQLDTALTVPQLKDSLYYHVHLYVAVSKYYMYRTLDSTYHASESFPRPDVATILPSLIQLCLLFYLTSVVQSTVPRELWLFLAGLAWLKLQEAYPSLSIDAHRYLGQKHNLCEAAEYNLGAHQTIPGSFPAEMNGDSSSPSSQSEVWIQITTESLSWTQSALRAHHSALDLKTAIAAETRHIESAHARLRACETKLPSDKSFFGPKSWKAWDGIGRLVASKKAEEDRIRKHVRIRTDLERDLGQILELRDRYSAVLFTELGSQLKRAGVPTTSDGPDLDADDMSATGDDTDGETETVSMRSS